MSVVPLQLTIVPGAALAERVRAFYDNGSPRGQSTGWPCVDDLYTVLPAQFTVVTGTPGSGKSEWLDALSINLARAGWAWAIYSPENHPVEEHVAKLAEKYVGKPFTRGPTPRMSPDERDAAVEWITKHYRFLDPQYRDPLSLLEAAIEWLPASAKGRGVILDPWNTFEHLRGQRTEAQYVSDTLAELTECIRKWDVNLWIVAHPKTMDRNRDGKRPSVPTPYDIAGGANWYNKADNIVCVHRDQADGGSEVEIHVQKVRFKRAGRVGLTTLTYDRVTGRYWDEQDAERYREASGR